MWHFFLHLLHPLNGQGYQFWSGIGSGSPVFGSVCAGIVIYWRKHNCHVQRCPWIEWHRHPVHGHPVCRKHHPAHKAPHLHKRDH